MRLRKIISCILAAVTAVSAVTLNAAASGLPETAELFAEPAAREALYPAASANEAALPALLCGEEEYDAVFLSEEEDELIGEAVERYYEEAVFRAEPYSEGGSVYNGKVYNFSSDYLYNQMSYDEQELYRKMAAACEIFDGTSGDLEERPFTDKLYFNTKTMTSDDAIKVSTAFARSNPQYFYLWGCSYTSGYVRLSVGTQFLGGAVRDKYRDDIDRITALWLPQIEACPTPREKELKICELLIRHIVYQKSDYDQSLAGALGDGICVCAGYAMSMLYFCSAVGIECVRFGGSGHAWNYIKLDGNWYIVDVTWMDDEDDLVYWAWCNISYERSEPAKYHIPDLAVYPGGTTLPDAPFDDPFVGITARPRRGGVEFSWTPALQPEAEYVVMQYVDGDWKRFEKISGTTYNVTDLAPGEKFTFRVGTVLDGYVYDVYNHVKTGAAAPLELTTRGMNNGVSLSWGADASAVKYRVFRMSEGDGYLTCIAEVPAGGTVCGYTDKGIAGGARYLYYVVGCDSFGIETSCSDQLWEFALEFKPPELSFSPGSGQIMISWKPHPKAVKYRVFSYTDGKYTRLGDTVNNVFMANGLKNGTKYGFLVLVYDGGEWCKFTSGDVCYAAPSASSAARPLTVKSTAGAGQAAVVCSSVSGAVNYRLFYTTNNGETYKKVGDSPDRKWIVENLRADTEYKFLVLAYNGKKWSSYKNGDCYAPVKPLIPKPATVKSTAGVRKAAVTCSTVAGAEKYRLFYTDDNGATYKKVGDTDTRKWTVKNLTPGVSYKFLVLTYDGKSWSKYKKGEGYAEVVVKD